MSFIVPQAAETDTLTNMIANMLSGSKMHLYASNITITSTTTLATLAAAECTFTGYSAYSLSSWGSITIDGSGAAVSTSTGSFTPTAGGGSGNIYGYYLTDSGNTKFYGAELLTGGPITVPQSVTLQIALTYSVLSRY
jgi:hypothetical protein